MLPPTQGIQLEGEMIVEAFKVGEMGVIPAGLHHGSNKRPMEVQEGGFMPPTPPRLRPPYNSGHDHSRSQKVRPEIRTTTPHVPSPHPTDRTEDTSRGHVRGY